MRIVRMTYSVKEVFFTLQGEGANTGRAAVFCRFAGCNLWSGKEKHRATAVCNFCDTDFVGTDGVSGGKYQCARELAAAVERAWLPESNCARFVVCTGGEPLLQLDGELIDQLHSRGFEVAVETNGTLKAPAAIDWICVSPKSGTTPVQRTGNELKLVFPQVGIDPGDFETWAFDHFFLQPMDGLMREQNTALAVDYCKTHPHWRLGLQMHKVARIP